MNHVPLAADVHERAFPYPSADPVSQAIANDPAMRSLPSDVLAARFGTSREACERAIATMVHHFTGVHVQPAGRSFDEAIADAGGSRRAALTPEPINEAAGPGTVRYRLPPPMSPLMHSPRSAPGRASFQGAKLARYMKYYNQDSAGYQAPPIPDLSALLLSDIFPVTRRAWSSGAAPTADEITLLNWQHPLITAATSPQSQSVINALAQGARSWDSQVTLPGGKGLGPRSADEQKSWWSELQILAAARGWLTPPKIDPTGWGPNQPTITIEYWDVSDASHPRCKSVTWNLFHLAHMKSSDSILTGSTAAGGGANYTWEIQDGKLVQYQGEGGDLEKGLLVNFSALISTVSTIITAIATVVAVYCPVCGIAISIAGKIATSIAQGEHVATKSLMAYGDLMLADARARALAGDSSVYTGLQQFAAALIGLPWTSTVTAATPAAGGLTADYLSLLGTAAGNVPFALQTFATYRASKIGSAADLATAASVPLEDAQYAIAALTDTLARFSANMSTVYVYDKPCTYDDFRAGLCTFSDYTARSLVHTHADLSGVQLQALANAPMIDPTRQPAASGPTAVETVGLVAAAWAVYKFFL